MAELYIEKINNAKILEIAKNVDNGDEILKGKELNIFEENLREAFNRGSISGYDYDEGQMMAHFGDDYFKRDSYTKDGIENYTVNSNNSAEPKYGQYRLRAIMTDGTVAPEEAILYDYTNKCFYETGFTNGEKVMSLWESRTTLAN